MLKSCQTDRCQALVPVLRVLSSETTELGVIPSIRLAAPCNRRERSARRFGSNAYNRGGPNHRQFLFHLRADPSDFAIVHVGVESQVFVLVKRFEVRFLAPKEWAVPSW
jgi:hypothetical protein